MMIHKKALAVLGTCALLAGGVAATPAVTATHAAAMTAMHAAMKAQAFSGVTGTATLSYDSATDMTTVKVMVMNLIPGSVHPAHIHAGKCTSNGPVTAALTSIKANPKGVGQATTMVKGAVKTPAYINVHLGPGLALTGYTVLSCGQIGMGMM